jgi:hypothetical protein
VEGQATLGDAPTLGDPEVRCSDALLSEGLTVLSLGLGLGTLGIPADARSTKRVRVARMSTRSSLLTADG